MGSSRLSLRQNRREMKILTLFRNPAYPALIFPSKPGLTPRFIDPQNLAAPFPCFPSLSASSMKSRFTVDRPPISPSHPVANWCTSVGESNAKSVIGACALGAYGGGVRSAPCMRSTVDDG
jgi:hypothetical protein